MDIKRNELSASFNYSITSFDKVLLTTKGFSSYLLRKMSTPNWISRNTNSYCKQKVLHRNDPKTSLTRKVKVMISSS